MFLKLIKWELRFVFLILITGAIAATIGGVSVHNKTKNGEIHIPFTKEEIGTEKWTTIQIILEDLGFTYIDAHDEITDSTERDGLVKDFIINGTAFDPDIYYPKDAHIEITFYRYIDKQ